MDSEVALCPFCQQAETVATHTFPNGETTRRLCEDCHRTYVFGVCDALTKSHGGKEAHLSYWEMAHRYDPENGKYVLQIIRVYLNQARYAETLPLTRRFINLNNGTTDELVYAYYALGIALSALERDSEALDAHQKALDLKPDYLPSAKHLCYLYAAAHRYEDAIQMGLLAIRSETAPKISALYYNVGYSYLRLGKYSDGVDFWIQTIQMDSSYASLLQDAPKLLEERGEFGLSAKLQIALYSARLTLGNR